MKRIWRAVLCLCGGILLLTGCGAAAPETAADGAAWSGDWVTVGNVLGVETPEGMTLRENSDVLDAKGMYFASWSVGEGDAGEDAVYDAQISLLLAGYDAAAKAEEAAAEWLDMAYERYAVDAEASETRNGQEYTVIIHTYTSETNPYAYGASAFGVYGNYAVSVELSCREDFDGDALALLAEFLDRCHYAA